MPLESKAISIYTHTPFCRSRRAREQGKGVHASLLPERLPFGGIVQVPMVLVFLKQSRHQLASKRVCLMLVQSLVLLHQSSDEEHRGRYFIFHLSF